LNIPEYIKAAIDQLSFSIGIASAVSSGAVIFSPWFRSNLDTQYLTIAWIVFIFSSVWVLWEMVKWMSDAWKRRVSSTEEDRAGLYTDIYRMLIDFKHFDGRRANKIDHLEVAAKIMDKYLRLHKLGIATPEIDATEDERDFDQHIQFLTNLKPLLYKSPMNDVKKHALGLLKS
jgi:hypothetical protein